jgi:hypothetical protein
VHSLIDLRGRSEKTLKMQIVKGVSCLVFSHYFLMLLVFTGSRFFTYH